MNNRLDLALEGWEDEPDSDEEDLKLDVEAPKQQTVQKQQPDYMDHFFREVDNIKSDIDGVCQASKQIAEIHEQALGATTGEEEDGLSQQLKPLIESSNNRARRTKTLLGLLKQETEKLKEEGTLNASDIR